MPSSRKQSSAISTAFLCGEVPIRWLSKIAFTLGRVSRRSENEQAEDLNCRQANSLIELGLGRALQIGTDKRACRHLCGVVQKAWVLRQISTRSNVRTRQSLGARRWGPEWLSDWRHPGSGQLRDSSARTAQRVQWPDIANSRRTSGSFSAIIACRRLLPVGRC